MIELSLLAGVILGLRCRIGLVLVATVVTLTAGFIARVGEDGSAASALGLAVLSAAVMQCVSVMVHALKEGALTAHGARA